MASFLTVFKVRRDKLGKSCGWSALQNLLNRRTIRLENILRQQKLLLMVRLPAMTLLDHVDLRPYLIVGICLDCKCIFT